MHTKLYRLAILTLLLAIMLAAGGAITGRASAASRTDGSRLTAARYVKFAKRTNQRPGYLTVRHYARPATNVVLRPRTAQPLGDIVLRPRTAQPADGSVLRPRTAQPSGNIVLRSRTARMAADSVLRAHTARPLAHLTLARR